MRGKRVCWLHGGKTPSGIASPHFKDGSSSRYLRHLPESMAPHFHADNPRLVELTEEIALIEAGVVEALERAGGRMTAKIRKEIWDLVERKARVVGIESRRRKDEHEMVSREEFGRFAKAVLMAVATHVLDPQARGKIQEDVLRMLAISRAQTIEAAGV